MNKRAELGFGMLRLPNIDSNIDYNKTEAMIKEYMKEDFAYFDLHPGYSKNKAQSIIKEFVVNKYPRRDFFLANKIPYYGINEYDDYLRIFNEELQACNVTYFDYYMLHAVTKEVYDMHERIGGFDFILQQKEMEKVKYAGISFHDRPDLLEKILCKYKWIDFVCLQINFYDWNSSIVCARENYAIAKKYNKKIIVMEPIKGGSLIDNYMINERIVTAKEMARLSLEFVASLDGVDIILSGMAEVEQIIENRRTLKQFEAITDTGIYEELIRIINRRNKIQCTACRYCEKECPKEIPISEIINLINQYSINDKVINRGGTLANYMNVTYEKGKASDCVKCGKCEKKCPQKLTIRKTMEVAKEMFEMSSNRFYSSERNIQILISLLKFHGIRKVVASPGSSNANFVYSLQIDDFFEIYSVVDERSAAYIACGLAEESGEPVVLSCTGATASRNYLPGLTEAYYRKLPILAVTAAQPNGRIGHNIPQVVDRRNTINDVVNMSVEMPIVNGEEEEWTCLVNANAALLSLVHDVGGPAHINLISSYSSDFSVKELPSVRGIKKWCSSDNLPQIPKGRIAIFCGSHSRWSDAETNAVEMFCKKYDAIVLCDHTSNFKGNHAVLANLVLSQEKGNRLNDFELAIHIGNVSGAYIPIKAKEVWRVNSDGKVCDTFRRLTHVFQMEEKHFFDTYLLEDFAGNNRDNAINEWKAEYQRLFSKIPQLPFSNLWIAYKTAMMLPSNSVLHLGILNSLRSWNYFKVNNGVNVYSNTGGFGIDGCVSSLIGASLANTEKIYYGVVGDLAFFYDMNSLGNRHVGNNVRLFVINNGCGTEFKNYSNMTAMHGAETDPNIAAKGHYGNKSPKLIKEYAEALGFMYYGVKSKEEYEKILPIISSDSHYEQPMLIEVFTSDEEESRALKLINTICGEKSFEDKNENMAVIPKRFQDINVDIPIVVWGAGNYFTKKLPQIEQVRKVEMVCDNNEKMWGKEISPGIKCISPEELKYMQDVFVVITIEDGNIAFSIANQLLEMGIDKFDKVERWLKYAHNLFL